MKTDRLPDILADRVPAELRFRDAAAGVVKIEAAAGDQKIAKFSMSAYNGGALNVGFGLPVVVDLAGMEVTQKSRPILLNHDTDRIVGHTDGITVTGSAIKATGVISGTGAHAREVIANAANGFPWQASIGATPLRMSKVEAGDTVKVNGQTFTGPLYVAAKTRLNEISFVPLGADDTTSAKVAAAANGHFLETYTMTFEQWLKARGHNIDDMTADVKSALEATFEAEQKLAKSKDAGDLNAAKGEAGKADDKPEIKADAGTKGDSAWDGQKAVAEIKAEIAERDRVAAIRAECGDDFAEIAAKAIDEKWDFTRTQLEVLRAKRPAVNVGGRRDAAEQAKVIEAALCLTAGLDEEQLGKQYGEKVMNAAVSSEHQGLGIHALIYETIRAAGGHARPGMVSNDTIRAAFDADRTLQASGFSTVSLSGILGNVANKTLLAAYESVNLVGERIARVEPNVPDFKAYNRYRLTGNGGFSPVGPDGEIKHMSVSEDSYSNQLDTEAVMIALTRQMMINDDLGAFLQLPRVMGRKAALSKEKAIFTTLLGGTGSFFTTGNKNYFEGAATPLSVDSITTAEQMLMDQVDNDGDPILVAGSLILVPTSLKVTAEEIYKETRLNETTTANKPKPASNPHANKFEVVASPYLNAQSLANASATAWYIFADPNDIPVIEIGYLRGRRRPVIESSDTNFNTLGMQWRAYQDFGVALQDPRGAVKSKGAA